MRDFTVLGFGINRFSRCLSFTGWLALLGDIFPLFSFSRQPDNFRDEKELAEKQIKSQCCILHNRNQSHLLPRNDLTRFMHLTVTHDLSLHRYARMKYYVELHPAAIVRQDQLAG